MKTIIKKLFRYTFFRGVFCLVLPLSVGIGITVLFNINNLILPIAIIELLMVINMVIMVLLDD